MTLSLSDLALYAGALLVLFLTPGPVWLAMLARSIVRPLGKLMMMMMRRRRMTLRRGFYSARLAFCCSPPLC